MYLHQIIRIYLNQGTQQLKLSGNSLHGYNKFIENILQHYGKRTIEELNKFSKQLC